jgi:DNA processing protein
LNAEKYGYYLWLVMLYGTADPKIHKAIEKYGSAKNVYDAIIDGDISTLDRDERERLKKVSLGYSGQMLEYCFKNEISVCALGDKEYPKLLAEIYDPPLIFFYRGDLSCLDALSLTFVGARDATPYITRLCARMTRDIAKEGVTIVSGMARGVDECAHMACVANNCKTVAVLACGIEVDYPYNSILLRNSIIDKGGAYISELLPRDGVSKDYFNPRNRILAGLTRGTAVFQASSRSGSLITANYAVDENRDVFCVPPPDIFAPEYSGVVELLRDGAIPVFNHDDILNEYRGLYI